MSSNINRVMLSGYLTRDPDLRSTTSGMQILDFGIAVNDRKKDSSGQWIDVPNFIDCVIFGARAEALSRFLSKGNKVALSGRLHYSSWEKDGQKRSKLDVIVDDVELMQGGKQQTAQASQAKVTRQAYAAAQQAPARDVYDENIPF
jgi:single-strand DNA-binding protein